MFAGPGGLGEGFSAFVSSFEKRINFKIVLSIEKDLHAHSTLTLRSFFRQFPRGEVPGDYYDFIKGKINLIELYKRWPDQAQKAMNEAWLAELGEGPGAVPFEIVDKRIKEALGGREDWLLVGGPPCQAYSIAGRSRRKEKFLDEKKDERVGLYKQYLRILAVHNPVVFVMENVKGLLSARTKRNSVFAKMLADLRDPVGAVLSEQFVDGADLKCPGYRVYSLVAPPAGFDTEGNPVFKHEDFIIKSEKYGIPQARHRVILLGIRKDIDFNPRILEMRDEVPISHVLNGLPKIRSIVSRSQDSDKDWRAAIEKINCTNIFSKIEKDVAEEIIKQLKKIDSVQYPVGGDYFKYDKVTSRYRPDWFVDPNIKGVCNHSSRGHMESDLVRYFFAACFAKVKNRSPKLEDFPNSILPAHKNVKDGVEGKKFSDRFRVQLWNKPCKTITSHISKDGHYYIHPDPTQCRSFTVREAARIQTFPDNYYFCGPRTAQFVQVGNAVPPLLANQIAEIVSDIFESIRMGRIWEKERDCQKCYK